MLLRVVRRSLVPDFNMNASRMKTLIAKMLPSGLINIFHYAKAVLISRLPLNDVDLNCTQSTYMWIFFSKYYSTRLVESRDGEPQTPRANSEVICEFSAVQGLAPHTMLFKSQLYFIDRIKKWVEFGQMPFMKMILYFSFGSINMIYYVTGFPDIEPSVHY